MKLFALAIFAVGEKDGTEDTVDTQEEVGFSETSLLQESEFETCERSVYWPAGLFAVLADGTGRTSSPSPRPSSWSTSPG